MKRLVVIVALAGSLVAAVLALGACGSDDPEASDDPAPTTDTSSEAAAEFPVTVEHRFGETTVEEVNGLLRAAADGPLAGILGYEERPLVSVDFKGDPRSGVVDALSTMVTDGTQVKILAWYDNEWGYANRLVELARTVAAGLPAAAR